MGSSKEIIMSNTDIFQHLVTTNMNDSEKRHLIQFHERVKFKLDAARYFLDRLGELEKKAGSLVNSGISRFDVELHLDAFFYEVVGAFDAQLQEINVAVQLPLDEMSVRTQRIINNLPNNIQLKKKLPRIHGDTYRWIRQ